MAQKLHVAFVWHMHQPDYKDRLSGRYLMPWVRLHAQKDYLDMLTILEGYPRLKQTFNLVPSLLEQLEDYASGGAWDQMLELLDRPVSAWSPEDRRYLLARGFDLQHERMLRPHARYAELHAKREALGFDAALEAFDEADWADLVTWFNLAWFDPHWLQNLPALRALVARGRGFDLAARRSLVAECRALCGRVIPSYRQAAAEGRVELTTTPYYHPILPLLCDTDSARVARPQLPLPQARFAHREDADTQIRRGIAQFERHFGHPPRGMWPSEQSVSPEALALVAEAGLRWAISDEGILAATLGLTFARDARGLTQEAHALYQPYWVDTERGGVAMVFRDIVLSDLIGFHYARLPAEEAAQDLYRRLATLRQLLPDGEPQLVTIALDGENCWEHYANDGADFLHAFYQRVDADASIELTTVSDYLDLHPPRRRLPSIFSGSWIASDFTTWIGEPTKNRAWDALALARQALVDAEARLDGATREAAWEELYIAEGSDWFWWFGEGQDSGQDELFDWQFRLHLQNIYQLIGESVPAALTVPLTLPKPSAPEASGSLAPRLDGSLDPAGWAGAAQYDPTSGQGAMHAGSLAIARLWYGPGAEESWYMGVAFSPRFAPDENDELVALFCYPGQPRLNSPVPFGPGEAEAATASYHYAQALHVRLGSALEAEWRVAGEYGQWEAVGRLTRVASGPAGLELALPLGAFDAPPGATVQFTLAAVRDGQLVELAPGAHPLEFRLPEAHEAAPSEADEAEPENEELPA